MPAFETLYQFEDHLEGAFQTLFKAAGINHAYRIREQAAERSTPRVELAVSIGGATGNATVRNGKQRHREWDFTLEVGIITDRRHSSASHSEFIGKIRAIMEDLLSNLDASALPNLAISHFAHGNASPSMEPQEGLDITEMSYTGRFQIRPSAWPE